MTATEACHTPESRRLGRFKINRDSIDLENKDMRAVMAAVIVVRAEWRYDFDGVSYVALCGDFNPVVLGERAPEYHPIVEWNEDGGVSVKWERVKESEPLKV